MGSRRFMAPGETGGGAGRRRSSLRRAVAAVLGGWVAGAGCFTYAPPLRGLHHGAPGRLGEGQVEIGGGVVAAVPFGAAGGPNLAVGIRDWVSIEAGGNFLAYGDPRYRWALGYLGPRFTLAPGRDRPIHFVADLELGAGAGAGGVLQDNPTPDSSCVSGCGDGRGSLDRIAWGGYQGIGIGGQFEWFTLLARVRVEETAATHVPLTIWASGLIGGEAQIGPHVALNLGMGVGGYRSSVEREAGLFFESAITLFFEAWRRRAAPAPRP